MIRNGTRVMPLASPQEQNCQVGGTEMRVRNFSWAAMVVAGVAGLVGQPQAEAGTIEVAVVTGSFYTDGAHLFLDGLAGVNSTEIVSYDAASLSAFDYVLHYGNSFYDQSALETYISGGGNLIATPWMMNNSGWFNSAASPIEFYSFGVTNFNSPLSVTVDDPSDPFLAGVNFNNGDLVGWEGVGTPRAGTINPVSHDDGSGPALSYMDFGAGQSFYINLHYITSDTSIAIQYDWGQQLLENIVTIPAPPTALMLGAAFFVGARRRRRA